MRKKQRADKKGTPKKKLRPPQAQAQQPGMTAPMEPQPKDEMTHYKSAGRFKGKTVVITGGDSGIGRAAAIGFAKEGADVAIVYLNEHADARKTEELVRSCGVRALRIAGDVGNEAFCRRIARTVVEKMGRLDVLCNNAAEQHVVEEFESLTEAQLLKTFRTNIFSMFYLSKACLPHMDAGSSIINTASITAYKGNPTLIDYSATKGAIVSFTRSLSIHLAERRIRVNGIAPGPVWTPLIPASFEPEKVATFGSDVPLGRAAEPDEIAPAMIFLASEEASYITGQVVHINGGVIVNG